jgi:hypothetical protein
MVDLPLFLCRLGLSESTLKLRRLSDAGSPFKRASAHLWDTLDLDNCVVDTIHRDADPRLSGGVLEKDVSFLDEEVIPRGLSLPSHRGRELPIIVGAGSMFDVTTMESRSLPVLC